MKNSKQSLLSYELNFYKELYETENEFQSSVSDKVFKTITIIIPIVSALIWLTVDFSKNYKIQCCYLQVLNIALFVSSYIITGIIIFLFFKVLFYYNDTKMDIEKCVETIEEYKQNNSNKDVINLMNETLIEFYKNATIKNSKENEKHSKLFGHTYWLTFVDILLLAVIFLIGTFL